jgi:NAD+ kinase
MSSNFPVIGLFAKPNQDMQVVLNDLIAFLRKGGHKFDIKTLTTKEIVAKANLIIVIGGDGSLLHTAREIVDYDIPVVGINRGKLGFLADIKPHHIANELNEILDGHYIEESRTMLAVKILSQAGTIKHSLALNDVVLFNGSLSKMLEFDIYVDNQYVMYQRADGLITSTPTGSTAYSMSGGGPILYPTLNAITLLPMFAHTLSTRPLVINDHCEIKLELFEHNNIEPKISCDGQVHISLECSDKIYIKKHNKHLRLIHPKNYNYFQTLREKLGWNLNLTSDRFTAGKTC